MTGSYDDDLRLAHTLADGADSITTSRFRALDLKVETKPDLSPVSDADKAVEAAIRGTLSRYRSRDGVLGEEEGRTGGRGARCWVVDPIDGTKNYVRGVPVWATLIALLDGDEVVVGVVSAPALGRRWWAATGTGAWTGKNLAGAKPCTVSSVRSLSDASLSYSDVEEWRAHGRLDAFLGLGEKVWRTRGYGDFWSYVLVAEGAVDVGMEPELSLWDMAAPAIVVEEAGGRFTALDGTPGPHGGSAVASNGLLHDAVLAAMGGATPLR